MELIELSKLVDDFDEKRTARLAADKIAKALKQEESAMSQRIIDVLYENDTYFAAGKNVRVKLNPSKRSVAEDWGQFYDYIIANDAMDLLEKRVHQGAVQERIDDGIEIPGIAFIQVNKLSIGKL